VSWILSGFIVDVCQNIFNINNKKTVGSNINKSRTAVVFKKKKEKKETEVEELCMLHFWLYFLMHILILMLISFQ